MKVLYMATNGTADATKASIPFHLAVNGSVEVGHETSILLAGDAAELMMAPTRDTLEGVGVPPLAELVAKSRKHEIPVYV